MAINKRTAILIAATLIVGLTAVIVKNKLSGLQGKGTATVTSNKILVATRDLAAGGFVNAATDIDWVEPKGDLSDVQVIREGTVKRGDFNGGVVRRAVKTGAPITLDHITKAGDGGFLSAVLEPGMRAVAVAVNATTGAAGFIAPGDRVDLIVTLRMKTAQNEDASSEEVVTSETFVRDVRVVAVDQSLNSAENKAMLAKNVTVEVNQYQAEQISVASEMGKISMALRSSLASDKTRIDSDTATDKKESESMLSPKGSGIMRVQTIRGDERQDLQFYGGKR